MVIYIIKCGIIIGTRRKETLQQIKFLLLNNIKIKNRSDEIGNIDLFYFPENSRKSLISPEFIDKLKKYDVLILSGGYTAYFFLNSSGFISIENKESIMPLVSIGVIHGGILNNKIVILKGGSIGNNDIYLKIIKTLDADTVNSPHE